ncbi:MAG: hypothetical protein ACRDBH_06695, partial [Bosea sp. (in: a-proteobacteria)]
MKQSWVKGSGYWPAAALFVFVWTVLCWPWLSGAVTIPYDAKAHFQAQIQFLAQTLHSGQSPFWLPNVFGGSPHVADPQSLIFSPALLLAWLDPSPSFRSVDAFILAHLLGGGLALLMFAREKGWHPAGGLVAAIIFAFGASAAWRVQHVGQIISLAFFAVALWLLVRALKRGSLVAGALAGLAAGLMIVEPNQVALLGGYALAIVLVDHWLAGGREAVLRSIRPLASASLVGFAVIALPLLWTVLFANATTRLEIDLAEASRGSLHPASLLTAWVADLFGAFDPNVEFWGPYSQSWAANELFLSQNMGQIYMGALPALLLLVPGLTRGWLLAREVRVLSLLALLMLLFALGRYTPFFALTFDYLPGIKSFRRPADATFLIGAFGALLAGYVVHRLCSEARFRFSWPEWALLGTLLAVVAATALGVGLRAGHLKDALQPTLTACLWITATVAVLWAVGRYGQRFAAAPALGLAVLLTADLSAHNGPNDSTALKPESYDILRPETRNETITLLKGLTARIPGSPRRDRVELVGLGFDWPNCSMVHGFEHTLGYNPLRLAEFSDAVGTRDTIAAPDERKFTPLFPSYRSRLADLVGLRYIASSVPIGQVDKRLVAGDLKFVAFTKDGYIYENTRALPRAMFVPGWQSADFDALKASGTWPEVDPTRTVLIEGEPPNATPAITEVARAELTMPVYRNTEVEIEVTTATPGFVVLNDVWHPWWVAEVNGVETEILKANVLVRAVQVPAGTSKV